MPAASSVYRNLEVLSIAADASRILVSHDRRTMPAHFAQYSATRSSPGLIIVDQDLDIGRRIAADLGRD
jgi:hypothetical protein